APRLEETAAIQMNDYFMLGISAGAPALLCFVGYIALSFRQSRGDPPSSILYPPSSFSSCSRAGALVLLTGFWFDGGLFKLATAVVFWTLLELGRLISMDDPERRFPNRLVSGDTQQSAGSETGAPSIGNPRAARVLWWIAGLFAFVAVALTAIHVITPRLSVSDRTLAIARNRLVQPAHRDDFDFLAAEPTPTPSQEGSLWRGKQLSILLDHVALADYNRTLVRWTIDDDLYRNFVLSPQISPAYDTEMNWRRCLWEHFYPRIRRESDPQAAVEIVIRELSRSLELQTDSSAPMSIRVIWTTGRADAAGFEAVAVAALRAIGIPARLDESGSKGEWFDGGNWRALPDARL
ncbi:MAG TPA: transglutaminase domain-containing protein, partial [Verrucomicrobiota bacterium]|nr:transglutaminase domain-containing protein [Verrucomicrobiota bacterium]